MRALEAKRNGERQSGADIVNRMVVGKRVTESDCHSACKIWEPIDTMEYIGLGGVMRTCQLDTVTPVPGLSFTRAGAVCLRSFTSDRPRSRGLPNAVLDGPRYRRRCLVGYREA